LISKSISFREDIANTIKAIGITNTDKNILVSNVRVEAMIANQPKKATNVITVNITANTLSCNVVMVCNPMFVNLCKQSCFVVTII
jgi:hypothetical protein